MQATLQLMLGSKANSWYARQTVTYFTLSPLENSNWSCLTRQVLLSRLNSLLQEVQMASLLQMTRVDLKSTINQVSPSRPTTHTKIYRPQLTQKSPGSNSCLNSSTSPISLFQVFALLEITSIMSQNRGNYLKWDTKLKNSKRWANSLS